MINDNSYVWFTFYAEREKDKHGRLKPIMEFKTRDGLPLAELRAQIPAKYTYLDTYENVPIDYPEGNLPERPDDTHRPEWIGNVGLILLTIRPAVSDAQLKGLVNKVIPRSFSWPECALIDRLKMNFFAESSRDELTLAAQFRDRVPAAHMECRFRQNAVGGSWFIGTDRRATAGYVAFLPRTKEFPAVLNVFGMGGNDTMRTAHLLRREFPKLISEVLESRTPRLLIFEMQPPDDFDDSEQLEAGLLSERCRNWRFLKVVDASSS
jgi:hypothetical protein